MPNKGFDLCRLACSLYDYFFDELTERKYNDVEKLIQDWIKRMIIKRTFFINQMVKKDIQILNYIK